jgi:chorismate mutase
VFGHDPHVEAAFEQIDAFLGERDAQIHVRKFCLVLRKKWREPEQREAAQCHDPQIARHFLRGSGRTCFDLFEFRQQNAAAVGIIRADFGQHDLARGALEQPDAKVLLETRHMARHDRGRDTELLRGLRETARVGDLDESLHGLKKIDHVSAQYVFVEASGRRRAHRQADGRW